MSKYYCPQCTSVVPIPMNEEAGVVPFSDTYRCPRCLHVRIETVTQIIDMSPAEYGEVVEEANTNAKKFLKKGAIALAILAVLGTGSSK